MEAITTSFTSRRPAAGTLPAFSLPPPNAEIPRTTDGLSPSLSVHTAGSQASQPHSSMHQYTYSGGNMQNSWNTGANYDSSQSNQQQQQPQHTPQQPLPQAPPYSRQPIYSHGMGLAANPRSSQSPATGPNGIAAPPFDQVQQHYTHDAHSTMASAAPQHSGIMSSQSPTQTSLPAHSDAYAYSRPGSNPGYYASAGPSQFSSYPPPQQSPSQASPTTGSPGSRGISSVANGMSYPRYGSYGQLPTMGGPIMSNMHQPGGQMSLFGASHGQPQYGGQMMYNQAPQAQTERPFKCDQCIQSFSRNHDLKRHKRIHLAVKPFPCNFCSKSFSRKDALKRHRLVKGCENKSTDRSEDTVAPRPESERERE